MISHLKQGKPDSIKVTYHCGLAEYYEWLTPEHSEFGLRKTKSFFRRLCKLNDSAFVFFRKCDDFMTFTKSEYFRIDRKITAIDILPSKYTEVKNQYWSKA
jgi:hypothetical protein